jgi:hypothetical protein
MRKILNYLRTFTDEEKARYYPATILVIVLIGIIISYTTTSFYQKTSQKLYYKVKAYKEINAIAIEAMTVAKNKQTLDSQHLNAILSQLGAQNYLVGIVNIEMYQKKGFELEFNQIPGDVMELMLKTFNSNNIYIYKLSYKILPTTGNYHVKLFVY